MLYEVITVNSKDASTLNLTIKGEYIGFENFDPASAEYVINGVKGTGTVPWVGSYNFV